MKTQKKWLLLVGVLLAFSACRGPMKDYDYQPFTPAVYFLTTQYAEIDGIRVAYVETGPPEAPALIFIHGLLGRLDSWQDNVPAFADRYRVLALDLPGFGDSEKDDRDYTIALFAQVVKGLMDQKNMAKATLIGNSMGGQVAAFFALHYPERVDKLVLVDSAGLMHPPFFVRLVLGHTNQMADWIVRRVQRRSQGKSVAEIYETLHQTIFNPERKPRIHLAADLKNPNVVALMDSYAHYYAGLVKTREFEWHVKAALRSARSIERTNLEKQVGAVRAPTLIVWGDEDRLVLPQFATFFHKAISGSQLVWIAGTGHIPQVEKPEEFNRAVNEFLAGPPR